MRSQDFAHISINAESGDGRSNAEQALRACPPCSSFKGLRTFDELLSLDDEYDQTFSQKGIKDLTAQLQVFRNAIRSLFASWKISTSELQKGCGGLQGDAGTKRER